MDFAELCRVCPCCAHAWLMDGRTCHGTTLITHGMAEVGRSATVIEDVEIRSPVASSSDFVQHFRELCVSCGQNKQDKVIPRHHRKHLEEMVNHSADSTEKLEPLGQHTLMADVAGESKRTACKSQAQQRPG